jgi:hypothetical protein
MVRIVIKDLIVEASQNEHKKTYKSNLILIA